MSRTHLHSERPVRDLWLAFGDIRGFNSIDDVVLSEKADIVRLNPPDISALKDAWRKSDALPDVCRAKSSLPFVGAVSCIDDIQELAHWVNGHIGRANTTLLQSSHLISNKETLYRLLEARSVPIPTRFLARHLPDLVEVLREVDGPLEKFVIKPVVGTESRGVYRPRAQQSPKDVVESISALPDINPREPFLVMPFISIDGAIGEYCLDGIVVEGRVEFCASHEKTHIYEGYPIHDRAMITPPANPIDRHRLDSFLARFGDAFPIKSFVFHLEVRLDRKGGIVPIDLSFRPGGGLIFKSIISSYGIDLRLAHMYCALSMERELLRLAHAHHLPDRFTAVAAVFADRNTSEELHEKLSRLVGAADRQGGLVNYDLSNISILSVVSQSLKPNVGLSIFSRQSADDCLGLLNALVADTSMSFVSAHEERPTRRDGSNAPDEPAPPVKASNQPGSAAGDPISRRIADLARRNPDTTAIAGQDRRLSFAELDAKSTAIARRLRREGVGLETPVGLLMSRSLEFIVAALAILKSGGCYVPFDKGFPKARLNHMLENARISHLITDAPDHAILSDYHGLVLPVDLDSLADEESAPIDVENRVSPQNLACILYTSGSTGLPKGVAVTREAILNLVTDQNYFGSVSPPHVLHSASIAFDATIFEIWAPLLNGGRCVVNPEDAVLPVAIAGRIVSNCVNTAWFNASLFNTIVEDAPEILENLSWVIAGGEVVSAKHFRRAQQKFPDLQLVNGYGPTEATTFSCCFVCPKLPSEADTVPIGKAIGGVELLVLDEKLNEVPFGSEGELHVGGPGLARGYYRNPALTAESFIPHPHHAGPGVRLYKTGDRVRQFPDGRFEFIGRRDRQIKLRGFRIELDEIEQAIRNLPGVQDVIVGSVNDHLGGSLIAKLKLSKSGKESSRPDDIKAALGSVLPAFMIPTQIEIVEALGRTTTGKRADTPYVDNSVASAKSKSQVQQSVLVRLAEIWSEVLDRENLGPQDDFFQLGGHSLSATRVLTRVKHRLGVELQLRDIFVRTRLADLATLIEEKIQRGHIPLDLGAAMDGPRAEENRRAEVLREVISRLSDDEVARLLKDKRWRRAWHAAGAVPGVI